MKNNKKSTKNTSWKDKAEVSLERKLGLFDSTMIVMGVVIGSGIFLTTGIMAKSIPSASLILLAWIVGGLLSLAGALAYAELGAAMPEAGGQYIYLREAYGPLSGFLFGWIMFLVYQTGSIAAVSVGFAEYFGHFFPSVSTQKIIFSTDITLLGHTFAYTLSRGQGVAIAVIIFLSIFNYIGLGFGSVIQNIFTVLKIGAIVAIVAFGFILGKGSEIDFSLNPSGFSSGSLMVGFGVAMIAVIWTFDGWNNINFTAGEIKNPKRNLPLSLILGTLGITALYAAINYIYLYALPISEMSGVSRIAEKATSVLFGGTSASLISAAVVISTFGCVNGMILTGPRVYYAMAKDNLFFRRVSEVHPRFKTPGFSIFIQALWACLLTLSGTYEQLFTYVTFAAIIFYIAAAASVFTLRKKYPDLPRPYKTWGYPIVPIFYIIASLGILINTLFEKPVESIAGLGFVVIGIPVYYYWKRKLKIK
jgi:APA family basic amino acid/polyamine antiporter